MSWQTAVFTLEFKHLELCDSHFFFLTLGPWFPNEMQNLLSSEKRTLDYWATNRTVIFFFSPGKTLLTLFVVQEWLDKRNTTFDPSACGGSWCTNPSLSPLLVKLPHTFEWPFHVHPLQAMVIPAGYAPFSSFSFSFASTFLSYFLNICIVIRHPVLIWLAFYRPIMWINVLLPGWRYKC